MFTIESYHDDDEKLRAMHNVNFSYHAHLHRCLEFSFCICGSVTVTVAGQSLVLSKNEGVIIPPTTIHSYHVSSDCEYYTILFGRNHMPDFAGLFVQRTPTRYSFTSDELLPARIGQYFAAGNQSVFAAKSILYHAADAFLRENAFVRKDAEAEDVAVRMLEYLQAHFRENLTLEDFARRIDYSYCYVSKLIRKNFGLPFTDLLAEYRIAYARNLLDQRSCSITEAALASGFGSIRNFNRLFLKSTGLTPSEYLRRGEYPDTSPRADEPTA